MNASPQLNGKTAYGSLTPKILELSAKLASDANICFKRIQRADFKKLYLRFSV